jgi:dihydropteroate synthase
VSGKIYLRPTAIIWGDVARQALAAGAGLPLAGSSAAFLAAELIEGEPGQGVRSLLAAGALKASAEPAIRTLIERITTPRAPLCGIVLDRTRLMGIVNVTPDSFSDGGDFLEAGAAADHARRLVAQGAEIVDIGGESTRPGSMEVPLDAETRRIIPVLERLKGLGAAISIDTRKAPVMEAAIAAGAGIINDVSALTHDAEGLAIAARLGKPIVLMHSRGDPRTMQDNPVYADVLLEVYDYLESRIEAAVTAGVPRAQLIADPGIGFGKTLDHNLSLLSGLSLFHGLGVAVLLGASRKRIIGSLTGKRDPKERLPGSLAVALVGAAQAVQILRVHDVDETRQALDVWRASTIGQGG